MVDRTSLIEAADMADLRKTYADGMQTLQDWSGAPEVTFTRRGGGAIGSAVCIRIGLDNRDARQDAGLDGTSSTDLTGTLKAFSDAIPSSLRQGDRFRWQGQWCQVVSVNVRDHLGVTEVAFRLEASSG